MSFSMRTNWRRHKANKDVMTQSTVKYTGGHVCTEIILLFSFAMDKTFATMPHALGPHMELDIFHDWSGSQRCRLELCWVRLNLAVVSWGMLAFTARLCHSRDLHFLTLYHPPQSMYDYCSMRFMMLVSHWPELIYSPNLCGCQGGARIYSTSVQRLGYSSSVQWTAA